MVIAGATGTQGGVTVKQIVGVHQILTAEGVEELHLGDCIGADEQIFELARGLGIRLVGHPPTNPDKRAFRTYDEERPPFPYLVRNRHIVDEVELLIATPKTSTEQIRSGTWSTVRYARSKGIRVEVIAP